MERPLKTLVVNADDFGLSSGINRGIRSAFSDGILRSTSIMPNGAAFDDAVSISRDLPGLGVGIHISLVDEVSVSGQVGRMLGRDGRLPHSYGAFVNGLLARRFSLKQVRAEVEAQVSRVLDAGINPTHIDSHQHLHVLPGLLDLIIETANSTGIRVIRVPLQQGPMSGGGLPRTVQLRVLRLIGRRARSRITGAGLLCADHFHGLSCSGHLTETDLLDAIERLQPGVNELMCHPGYSDSETADRYRWGYQWDVEAATLCSPAVIDGVHSRQIRLANFCEAWRQT